MNFQQTPNTPNHGDKLPAIYLWIPIWIALLALGWVMQKKYYADAPNIYFNTASEPVAVFGVNKNITTLKADRQGHYLFIGYINGKQVKFLLDTGATSVAIPGHIADYLGLSKGQEFYSTTANGKAVAFNSLIKTIKVGSIEQYDIRGAILPGMKNDAILLGMSFLKDLEMSQKNGEITLIQYKH